MTDRRIDGFFYGLFMDSDVLRESQVVAANPRRAYVDDFALRIGRRATTEYAARLRAAIGKLEFPAEYIASIS